MVFVSCLCCFRSRLTSWTGKPGPGRDPPLARAVDEVRAGAAPSGVIESMMPICRRNTLGSNLAAASCSGFRPGSLSRSLLETAHVQHLPQLLAVVLEADAACPA